MIESDPLWYKDAIIYELHVKAFFDSNDDGMGDFPGLIQKLDYLQDLGVTCIWLLPFYPSPLRDDGYDISDYHGVHPGYGTPKDFKLFVREAHRRGIRVITELVINHTSDQHPWFQAARNAPKGSAKRDYYVWSDSPKKYDGVRIIFTDSEPSNWSWDPVAKQYYWHRFFHHQPDLNFDNPHVLRAVFKIMRFWLDMGVDGMRLDAIPYLIEREGTNCENLPESHAILKAFRKEMDAHYQDRLFLAEANQWPADVLPYFGESDECHMTFHFPLMPRMFMAIRSEDRHPIVEIMRQTPEIPPDCQWALFLRNHDELTLEMVTAEERDYMYKEYAADPRMRLNLGIRRRLAPLIGNSRRRIELLNMMLFSLPGTPVLYYGDEIGMGDNIYLGDRDGVRTPMQWNGDRNAGFSRADFARLYAPPIMDTIYGYQAINVESQQRDPSSLLQFMKRLIALRKRYKAFGRGSLDFLHPQNRKVLVYVREFEDERILVVANLSRFVQPVELDLARFKGQTPFEMFGRVQFPMIGDTPYFLALAPSSCIWFQLETVTSPTVGGSEQLPAHEVEAIPKITLTAGWETLLEGRERAILERAVLPAFIRRQRWFGSKSRMLETVSIRDWITFPGDGAPTVIVYARTFDSEGNFEDYQIPMAVMTGSAAEAILQNSSAAILAHVASNSGEGILCDATISEEFSTRLLDLIGGSREIKTRQGRLAGQTTSAYEPHEGELGPIRRGTTESSNSSVGFGDRYWLKLCRRMIDGPSVDYEVGRFLTEKAGFPRAPKTLGVLEFRRSKREPRTVSLLRELIPNQGQAWELMLEVVGRYFEEVSGEAHRLDQMDASPALVFELSEQEVPNDVAEILGSAMLTARVLGQRTAELHLALASEPDDPDFAPEPLAEDELTRLSSRLVHQAGASLGTLKDQIDTLPADLRSIADELLAARPRLMELLSRRPDPGEGLVKIRVHGDYHLGQLLLQEGDFFILDFEGEPGRSIEERRAKQSPLKDVAGMLRSFDYVAYSALYRIAKVHPDALDRLEPWAKIWRTWMSAEFLKEYRRVAKSLLPTDSGAARQLLDLLRLEKALFELQYELDYRPDWVRIPLMGILHLIRTEETPGVTRG
ncbi:maltose alpha-D-glucosyltransferase [Tundrisphaera lichenicola]|uniref:maltose alpha-D-glucosyltransferase n=1 Tax=Tundrisphaera lichenicola TaxID=2029860 RepID=UPI003EC013B4